MQDTVAGRQEWTATPQGILPALGSRPLLAAFAAFLVLASVALLATKYYLLAAAPSLALLLFLLLYRRPDLGFYLVVFLIPFGGFRKIEGPFTLNVPWLLASLLLLVVAVRLLPGKQLPSGINSPLWKWLLLYFAVCLISAFLSAFPATAFANIGLQLVSYLFILLGMTLVSSEGLRRWLPGVLVASISISSLLAVLGTFFNLPLFAEKHGEELVRGIGGSIDPNNMSLMILFVVPFLARASLGARGRVRRLVMIALLALNLGAIATTFSRGGALMTVVTGVFVLREVVRVMRPKTVVLGLAFVAAGLVTFLSFLPSTYWDRMASLFSWEDTALSRRSTYIVVGRDASLRDPVFGSGPGTFRDLYAGSEEAQRFAREGRTTRRYAHNTYLEVLVGTGVLGLAVLLAILLCADLAFGRAARRLEADGDLSGASLVRAYRIGFRVVCLYLFIFSDAYHKYLLLSLGASHVADRLPAGPSES